MTFLDLFAGIGGFRRGMELAGHECVGFCEWDKFATASYTSMHLITEEQRRYLETLDFKKRQKEILKEEYRNGEWYADDIRSVRAADIPRADCWCFGFPCQDISVAGKQKGFNGNRSSLFFTVTRLLRAVEEESRPKYLFIENVKNLLSVNRGYDFARLLVELDEIGYDAEWQVLNSKDFGVPQNRERVFVIGHLRGRGRREVFPLAEEHGLSDTEWIEAGTCLSALTAIDYKGPSQQRLNLVIPNVQQIGNCMPSGSRDNPNQGRVYDIDGLAPTLTKMEGGGLEPHILTKVSTITSQACPSVMVKEATKTGYAIAEPGDSINLTAPGSKTRRGRVGNGVANTLDTSCNQGTLDGMRIRRLTPKECFRLQGWTDDYFYKAQFVNSDSQLYKQAGNGVTVNVIEAIGRRLK